MKSTIKKVFIASILLFFAQINVFAQENIKSPKASAEGKNVKVTYGQPSKKGRVIFGDLVPYDKVWRTGANEATEITFEKNVTIDKKEIKAGIYSLFTIPHKDKWTIILNSSLGQWGAYDYEKIKDKDVLNTEVTTKKIPSQEKLTFLFKDSKGGTILIISWDDVEVELPMKF